MDQAALEQRLDALTTEASDSYDTEQAATRSQWRALVRAYLFWTDCQTVIAHEAGFFGLRLGLEM